MALNLEAQLYVDQKIARRSEEMKKKFGYQPAWAKGEKGIMAVAEMVISMRRIYK